jgi:DNA-binding MarR family transcriptional regulator
MISLRSAENTQGRYIVSSEISRDELKAALLLASRKVGSQAALWSQAVAERLGLASSDVECLDTLLTEGRLTVGRLAELTGLTTGSATRMVDRLEQAGFVRRVPDPADRRRVMVEPVAGVEGRLGVLHDSFRDAQIELIEQYDDDQLRVLADFLTRVEAVMKAETARLRAPGEEADESARYAARLGGVTAGHLVFVSGAPRVQVRGDASLTDLYRAAFQGPVPKMRVRDGVVTVGYPRFAWFDWRAQVAGQNVDVSAHWGKDRGEIVLNATVPWSIELRGGVSRLEADLRAVRLESFEARGGASMIELVLPRPSGIVPIRLSGGLNRMSIRRPPGVAMGLEVKGGVSEVEVDGESYRGVGGLAIQTPDADKIPDRYEIEIAGGVAKLSASTF